MKTILSFFATSLFAVSAHSQTSTELTCRAQAKEVALQAYNNCASQARNQQIDEIRKNYQKDLALIKAKYDSDLKKLNAGKGVKITKASKPTLDKNKSKALPAVLPPKEITSEPLSVQFEPEKEKVIPVVLVEEPEEPKSEVKDSDSAEIVNSPREEN